MEELSESARKILEILPKDGSMVGNISLRKRLRLDASEFFQAKRELQKQGTVVTGAGRGGSIGLAKVSGPPSQLSGPPSQPSGRRSIKAELSESAKKILEVLPKDGSMMGNISLRNRLGLDTSEFQKAKLQLQEQGKVVVGKGKGGSIGLVEISIPISKPIIISGVKSESELYPHIKKYFDEEWGPGYTTPDYYCSIITATTKGHRIRGLWSRPDVSILTVTKYQFLPTKLVEVTTIEAKRYGDATPQAVFETASHSKFAHQSYLIIEWLEDTNIDDTDNENVKRILKEAQRFGIGIIQMKNNRGKWEFRDMLDPQRHEPEPEDCNTFIEQNFKPFHKQIQGSL
jgi:hypothetical protein